MSLDEKLEESNDKAARAIACVLEALTNTEYIDWLTSQDASTFSPVAAKAVEMTLRDAHNERIMEAMVSLRVLDRLLIELDKLLVEALDAPREK